MKPENTQALKEGAKPDSSAGNIVSYPMKWIPWIFSVFFAAAMILILASPIYHHRFIPYSRPIPIGEKSPESVAPLAVSVNKFPVPQRLCHHVQFWIDVFTKFTKDQLIVHDDRYPQIVYAVLHIRDPDYSNHSSRRKKIQSMISSYRQIVDSVAQNWHRPEVMDRQQRRIYEIFSRVDGGSVFPVFQAASRIRIQQGLADSFRKAIELSGQWLAMIKQILREEGLPEELACLPLIESAFDPHAVSFRGAAGMWQLMRGTARQYGLVMNHLVDERLDPFRSTRVAARILKHNYRQLSSWPLAITAYNHGLYGVRKAVRQTGTSILSDIIEDYEADRFGFASRNFYAEWLAAIDVFQNASFYFKDIRIKPPLDIVRFQMPDHVRTQTVLNFMRVSINELRELNPALLPHAFEPKGFIPKGYWLNLPGMEPLVLITRYESIPTRLRYVYLPNPKRHRIRKHQTLSEIASIYDTSVRALLKTNGLKNPRKIRAGQYLTIPGHYHGWSSSESE